MKVEPQPNIGHDAIQEPLTLKIYNTDGLNPILLIEEHTGATNDIQNDYGFNPRSIKQIRSSQLEEVVC